MAKGKKDKPGYFKRKLATARQLVVEPRSAGTMLRDAWLRVWRARGGGLYGIGYLVTFITLEVRMVLGEAMDSDDALQFIASQATEHVLRYFTESIGNMVQAFIWPLLLISWLGASLGLITLFSLYAGFEYILRPLAEARFPELREDRLARAEKREKNREKKREKKRQKKDAAEETRRSN